MLLQAFISLHRAAGNAGTLLGEIVLQVTDAACPINQ